MYQHTHTYVYTYILNDPLVFFLVLYSQSCASHCHTHFWNIFIPRKGNLISISRHSPFLLSPSLLYTFWPYTGQLIQTESYNTGPTVTCFFPCCSMYQNFIPFIIFQCVVYHISFIHLLIDGLLHYFYFGTVMSNVAMTIHEQVIV